ncbi:MAG: relaxase/mobilization nuclease domain-containing protein [Clostridia bacterium]|nr:relaxase/mobilization nuclease domain-containing protein [Clostridia bacterium]
MPNLKQVKNNYTERGATERLIRYVYRKALATGGYSVDPQNAAYQMDVCRLLWNNVQGTQVVHYVLSLNDEESAKMSLQDMRELSYAVCRCFAGGYQIVFGVHHNSRWHVHFIMNAVRYTDGKRYPGRRTDDEQLAAYIGEMMGVWVDVVY